MLQCCWKWLIRISATAIIVFALIFNVARLIAPLLDKHQARIATLASHVLHRPVKIGDVKVTWYNFQPAFLLTDVSVLTDHGQHKLLHLHHFIIAIDLLSSLLHLEWLPGKMAIDGVSLTVKQLDNGQLQLQGVDLPAHHGSNQHVTNMLVWLLTQAQVTLKHVNIIWLGQNHFVLPVKDLTLEVSNSDFSHHIVGQMHLAQFVPTHFHFVIDFNAKSPMSKAFSAKMYLQASDVALAQWQKLHDIAKHLDGVSIASGMGDVSLWANWNHGRLSRMHALLALAHVAVRAPELNKQMMLNKFSGNVLYHKQKNSWRLSGDKIDMTISSQKWRQNQFSLENRQDKGHQEWAVSLGYFRYHNIATVLSQLNVLPESVKKIMARFSMQGDLSHISVHFINNAALPFWQNLSAHSEFSDLGFTDQLRRFSVSGLKGTIDLQSSLLQVNLSPNDAELNLLPWFYKPFYLKQFAANLQLQFSKQQWQLTAKNMHIDDGNMQMQTGFVLQKLHGQTPLMNLNSKFSMKNAALIKHYLPKVHLSKKVYNWLSHAFPKGSADHGVFHWQGPLKGFPYLKKQGVFDIDAKVHHVELHYEPGWPNLHDVNGDLHFHDAGMHIQAQSGRVDAIALRNITANIANLKASDLTVSGDYEGRLSDAKRFLVQTPLSVGKQFADLSMQGHVKGRLALALPIHHHSQQTLKGNADVSNGTLSLPQYNVALKKLDGDFHFSQDGILAKGVRATFLKSPLNIAVLSKADGKQHYVDIHLAGQMNMANVIKHYQLKNLNYVSGQLPYRIDMDVYPLGVNGKNHLSLKSDLKGLVLSLPQPLKKAAKVSAPLALDFTTNLNQPMHIKASYDHILSADLLLNKKAKAWQVKKGQIHVGHDKATMPKLNGLVVSIDLPAVNVKDWQTFFQGDKSNTLFMPRLIDVKLTQVMAFNQIFKKLHLKIQPSKKAWFVSMQSLNNVGQLSIPKNVATGELRADFQRFHYAPLTASKNKALSINSIPSISLHVNDFWYKSHSLGQVDVSATHKKNELQFSRIAIKANTARVDAKASWIVANKKSNVTINGALSGNDLGQALSDWGVTKTIAKGNGSVHFDLAAPTTLPDFSLKQASGVIQVQVGNGRILKLSSKAQNELGLGRMLNMFSLQSLPRRLMFNFGDLSEKGFAFDYMKGAFTLVNGEASTTDAQVSGPVANVLMDGSLSIANKTYDMILSIEPKVTDSLPMVATLAGGPLAGAITWLVNKVVVSPTIGQMTKVRYFVGGSWDVPFVKKLK